MEDFQKAINLFSFIKGLNEIKKETITNVEKQLWKYNIGNLPENEEYIQVFSRDRQSDDEVDSNMTILKVKKPEFDPCPKPDPMLEAWLNSDWSNFRKAPSHLQERRLVQPDGTFKIIKFEDNPEREKRYDEWTKKREPWADKQRKLDKIRALFTDIVMNHLELEANSETEEMIVANGFLLDSANTDINHPILSRRVKTEFDEENNIVSIVDTDNASELYISMLRGMNDLNHEQLAKYINLLAESDFHPLDTIETPKFLKSLIHALSVDGEFSDTGIPENWTQDIRFLLYMNPVIVVRKKLDGSIKAIESIIENIKETEFVPNHLLDIISGGKVEIPEDAAEETIEQKLAAAGGEDTEIFLTKEANREQLEIAQRIEKYNAVLVQGPPGTGKTHTIANLLGHFLAQGKSVLITSHTSKALNVLKDKIDEGIRDLCVSVLDESNHDMEKSVDGIVDHMSSSSTRYKNQMEAKATERKEIIRQLAKTRQSIFKLINQECNTIVINGEEISPSEAAKFVVENEDLNYIPGEVRKNSPLPLTFDELVELYKTNKSVSEHEEMELDYEMPGPKELLPPVDFAGYWEKKRFVSSNIADIEKETGWKVEFSPNGDTVSFVMPTGHYDVVDVTQEKIDEFYNIFSAYKNYEPWMLSAAIDGSKGGVYKNRWTTLSSQIEFTAELSEKVVGKLFGHKVEDNGFEYSQSGIDTLNKIKDKLSSNGKIGKFDRLLSKTIDTALNQIRIDGKEIASVEDVELLLAINELDQQRHKCASFWDDLVKKSGGVSFFDLDRDDPEHAALRWAKVYEEYLDWASCDYMELCKFLNSIGISENGFFGITSFDSESVQLEKQLRAVNYTIPRMLDCIKENMQTKQANDVLSAQMAILQKGNRTKSEICLALFNATKNGDDEQYIKLYGDACELFGKYSSLNMRREYLNRLDPVAHEWAEAIRKREGIHGEESVPSTIEKAWMWKQYSETISDILKEPYEKLQRNSASLSKKYREVTAQYAEKSAWYHLLTRTETDITMRQALIGWKQTVKKIGKGTGKNAPKLKAEAKKMMTECQRAVPAWIMTVNKALDSLDPKENRFDIIIIDEASQSDLSSMAILYMADKIIVVGDDKQVSPMAVGVQNDQIQNLANEYLNGVMHISHLFDAKTSIYDIAATTFQPLMLTEHFRCVPEIINYSNMLSYDWKIKPLREAGSSKLLPATVNFRVNGFADRKMNKAEEEAIIALIKSCIEQPEYDGKTFGVISMVGEIQAKNIQTRLFEELGPKEYQKRKILCGNSANFQGDERDVIFLSMVDSGKDEGPLVMRALGVDDSNRKRFNVAVSRAKDQLWVVTSLDSANDLKSGDLRKGLIDYVKNPKAFEEQKKKIIAKADSPFEVEVVSYLVNRGYHITQQWPVGSYRLDMVAECGNKKVAIECDGEKYHGDDMTAADMERQTILERIGWRFIRLRGSEYYSNKEATMQRVISDLHSLGIEPEESEMVVEETRDTDLLKRVKASAAEKLKDFEWFESEINTIAGALESTLPEEPENESRACDEQPLESQSEEALLEEQRLKEKAERKSYEEELERQRKLAEEQKQLERERQEAEEARLAELERQRLAEEERAIAAKLEKERIAQEEKAKAEALEKARLEEEKAKQEASNSSKQNKEKTFEEKLAENGFEFIDNRATANLIWIIGSKDDEELIRECLDGLKFRSIHFEKRGAFRTGNRPAWLVSFSGGYYGKK